LEELFVVYLPMWAVWARVAAWVFGRTVLGGQYLDLMTAQHGWEPLFTRHGFDVALVPADWPLATVLKRHPAWQLDYDDGQALVLRRVAPGSQHSANPTKSRGEKGNSE